MYRAALGLVSWQRTYTARPTLTFDCLFTAKGENVLLHYLIDLHSRHIHRGISFRSGAMPTRHTLGRATPSCAFVRCVLVAGRYFFFSYLRTTDGGGLLGRLGPLPANTRHEQTLHSELDECTVHGAGAQGVVERLTYQYLKPSGHLPSPEDGPQPLTASHWPPNEFPDGPHACRGTYGPAGGAPGGASRGALAEHS